MKEINIKVMFLTMLLITIGCIFFYGSDNYSCSTDTECELSMPDAEEEENVTL